MVGCQLGDHSNANEAAAESSELRGSFTNMETYIQAVAICGAVLVAFAILLGITHSNR